MSIRVPVSSSPVRNTVALAENPISACLSSTTELTMSASVVSGRAVALTRRSAARAASDAYVLRPDAAVLRTLSIMRASYESKGPQTVTGDTGLLAVANRAGHSGPMNKAFVKESEAGLDVDDDDDGDTGPALPRGQKNYMTPEGHDRLVDELTTLRTIERPKVVEIVSWAAGNGDRSENGDYIYGKKRLREIDKRMRFLMKRLDIAEVVDPANQTNRDQVFFGAWVRYADGDGVERTVRIVGVDEADLARGEVSWVSPIARALHKAYEGDVVKLRTPRGIDDIEVIEISYEPMRT